MNALVLRDEFFAPVPEDGVSNLLEEYALRRAQIESVVALFAGDVGSIVSYFISGNCRKGGYSSLSAEKIFQKPGAIASLNAEYWSRVLALTDIYSCMPQPRRDAWNSAIHDHTTPDFTEQTVLATLADLLAARSKFLAERVDGLFQRLSDNHVTNCPGMFYRRMILAHVFSDYGSASTSRSGTVNDLRSVIAKFMGRDEPNWYATYRDLETCRKQPGKWFVFDGGALRIKVYKIGTCHLEVHPELAVRLNAILHCLHPRAIAANMRARKVAAPKAFAVVTRPLPFSVLQIIRDAHVQGMSVAWDHSSGESKSAFTEAARVLSALGGVKCKDGMRFDYDPKPVLRALVVSGCIPDQASHQYFPTPKCVVEKVRTMADIQPGHRCLEPSAGTGSLARLLPRESAVCVELSALHCEVLRAKRYDVVEADFLLWQKGQTATFERIVMNPPFSEGRAIAHVTAAASLLGGEGRLIAVLPATLHGRELVAGCDHAWSEPIHRAFVDTGVSVAVVAIQRRPD